MTHFNDLPRTAAEAAACTSIGGWVDLRGYPHPLPLLASIGGAVDLRDYPHPLPSLASIGRNASLGGYAHASWPWLINGRADSRRYYFTGMLQDGEWRIKAGCRDFSVPEALAHWADNPECLAIVQELVVEIEKRVSSKLWGDKR